MNKQDHFLPNDDLERIDNVCTQFEESCQTGAPPQIEEVVDEFQGRARQQALLELLLLDLEYRAPADLEQAEAVYRRRFKSDWPVVAAAMKKHRAYQSNGQPQKKKPAKPTPTELVTLELADERAPSRKVFTPAAVPERVRYLNDYELIEEIARGGMGIVYRAKDRRLNRIVAIKMLLPGELASEDQIDRFLREARTAAKLRHPNIVTVYEVGLQDEVHFFAMDYIDGQDLEKFSREHSPTPALAVKYVVEAARAVHYAHSERVLHRDLKPSNLLIDQDGEIHVTDFGLAKSIAMGETITKTGMLMGTPSYMPPEQAKGDKDKIGVQSDVYGLGAVLFFLLTGRPPFEGDTPFEVITAVLKAPLPSLRSLNSNVTKDLEMICRKCLEKEPENRYRSAAALADDLERWLSKEPIRARKVGLVGRTKLWLYRHWKETLAAVLIVIAMRFTFVAGGNSVTSKNSRNQQQLIQLNEKVGQLENGIETLNDQLTAEKDKNRQLNQRLTQLQPGTPNTGNGPQRSEEESIAVIRMLWGRVESSDDTSLRVSLGGVRHSDLGTALEHLKGLTNLKTLVLSRTKVTDTGLEHLQGMTNLETLFLNDTEVTDAGLKHLQGMTNLTELNLYNTKVTDAGLEHLKGLINLEKLYLNGINVTDAGLIHLKGLTSLKELRLNGTKVSDAGLEYLKGLTNLTYLNLENTLVTHSGVVNMFQHLPNCLFYCPELFTF